MTINPRTGFVAIATDQYLDPDMRAMTRISMFSASGKFELVTDVRLPMAEVDPLRVVSDYDYLAGDALPPPNQVQRQVKSMLRERVPIVWSIKREAAVLPFLSEQSLSGDYVHKTQDLSRRLIPHISDWNRGKSDYEKLSLWDCVAMLQDKLSLSKREVDMAGEDCRSDAKLLLKIHYALEYQFPERIDSGFLTLDPPPPLLEPDVGRV